MTSDLNRYLRIMVDEGEIRAAVAEDPDAFADFWWGSRLTCVVVDLRRAPADQVRELLTEALRRKAPRRLVRAFEGEREGGRRLASDAALDVERRHSHGRSEET